MSRLIDADTLIGVINKLKSMASKNPSVDLFDSLTPEERAYNKGYVEGYLDGTNDLTVLADAVYDFAEMLLRDYPEAIKNCLVNYCDMEHDFLRPRLICWT